VITSKKNKFLHSRRNFLGTTAVGTMGLYLSSVASFGFAQDVRMATIGNTVSTQNGKVRGLLRDGVQQFWGIPYGASTANENRFMPPQSVKPWSDVRDQFHIGNRSYQAPGVGEPAPVVLAMNRLETEGEDCLNLNVFTPGTDNRTRPVMVWMHGGGFSSGSGNYLMYDGTNLAKQEDVVVVVVTHRLNIFGLMHLADMGDERWAQSTNVGVQDLVASLQWVKDNIAEFGGDPGNVTIFGQSGGAGKTTTLMATPSASGLFHRCIAQSGSAITGVSATDASAATEQYLSKLGIGKNQLDKLQILTPKQIQDAFYSEPVIPRFGNGPVIDGSIIPRNQWSPTAPSFSANVPLMAGSTQTENGWVGPPAFELADAEMLDLFTSRIAGGNQAKGTELLNLYKNKYPNTRNRMLWLTAESDNTRRWDAQLLNRLKTEQAAAPSYLYLFNWHSPVHDNRMGSYHTLDIPFVFNNVDVAASMTGAANTRYELAHVMSAAWAAFARTGNPNHEGMAIWPAFNATDYPTMVFGDEIVAKNDPNKAERLALAALR